MEQTTENALYVGTAVAAQPSPLAQLIDQQEKTKHLLQVLAEKIQPVTNPHPVDSKDRLSGNGYHIQSALSQQYDINDAISYLIDTVVL